MRNLRRKQERGITLIALIITIILMLILVAVTIRISTNGKLFQYAGDAKNETEITNEKEIIMQARVFLERETKEEEVIALQQELDRLTEEGTTTVTDNGETMLVQFNTSGRIYEVDEKGKITGPIVICEIHTYNEESWITVTPATCQEEGTKYTNCTVCGIKIEAKIEKIAHNYEEGICTMCGASIVETITITGASEVYVGETIQLTATITSSSLGDLSIGWESSDEKIATVDDKGIVTGVSGTTETDNTITYVTITATCAGKQATHTVRVIETTSGRSCHIVSPKSIIFSYFMHSQYLKNYKKLLAK